MKFIKVKKILGYKIIETPCMFIILWNEQAISGLNIAHCEKFTKDEFDFLKKELKDLKICIASNNQSEINSPELKFDEVAYSMLFVPRHLLKENDNYEVKLVKSKQDLDVFCNIAGEVFHMKDDVATLQTSLLPDLKLDNCDKYIGYKNGIPAGIVEICRGSEAALISWVGVKIDFRKQGLCRAMLAHAINKEIAKGCHKFVLVATELGQKVYSNFGFEQIASRFDYILENKISL